MKKCSKKLFLLTSILLLLLTALVIGTNAANIEAEIKNGGYGEPIASGDCYNASGVTYNAKWALYNSKTSGRYVIYFSLDTKASSNTELILGFDPTQNSGNGGIVGGWGANLTNAKYPWSSYHTKIDTLVIGDGVTKMASPFYQATSMKTMEIPATLTEFGSMTLFNSNVLEYCYIRGNEPILYNFDASNITYAGQFCFCGLRKIQSFELSNSLTLSGTNIFDDCSTLKSITIPASVTNLPSKTFDRCGALECVTFLGNTSIAVVSSATTLASAVENKDGNAFARCTSLKTINAFPGTKAYSFAEKFGLTIGLPTNGVYSTATDDGAATISIDLDNGVLTIEKNSGYDTLNICDEALQSFMRLISSSVKEAVIDSFSLISFAMSDEQIAKDDEEECYFNLFAYLPNLEKVHFLGNGIRISTKDYGKGLFEGANSLKTVGFGERIEENIVDISGIICNEADYPENYAVNLLAGCSSMTNVKLPEDTLFDSIERSTFAGCTSLFEIIIPENITFIAERAFRGCFALESAIILGEKCEYTAEGENSSFESITKITNKFVPQLNSAAIHNGFSIRYKDYNGLRGIFCFDNEGVAKENTEKGYTLIEYGTILTTAANKMLYGAELSYNESSDSYEATAYGLKQVQIWSNGSYKNKILGIGKASENEIDGATYFAVSVVNYKNNYRTDVYMCAYEVWEFDGEKFIIYSDYENSSGNSNFNQTNIYKVSLEMYKTGVMSAKYDDGVVWKSLVNGGAVTLTKGTGFTVEDGLTDMNGNEFGNSFTVSNVPFCKLEGSSLTLLNTDFTLLEDADNSNKYIIVFRGEGAIPSCSIWGSARMQYGSEWLKPTYYDSVKASPSPIFTSATSNKIYYAICDYGIDTLGSYMFADYTNNTKIETVVYPETLISVGYAFTNGYPTTVFRSETPAEYIENGLYDLHYGHLDISKMNINGNSKVRKLHLPTNFTSIAGSGVFNSTRLERIWCSDSVSDKGEANVLDFSGATKLTHIGGEAFINTAGSPATVLRLPDSCVNLSSNIFIQTNAANKCSITKIEQNTYSDKVSAFCSANSVEYVTSK